MGNISKKEDAKNTELEIWEFLYREWSKLNDIVDAYNKIFKNININNDRYNQALGLIIDTFKVRILASLDLFFQKRKDVWSLYEIKKIPKNKIDGIRKQAEEFLIIKNNKTTHLSKKYNHKSNFEYFTRSGIEKIKKY